MKVWHDKGEPIEILFERIRRGLYLRAIEYLAASPSADLKKRDVVDLISDIFIVDSSRIGEDLVANAGIRREDIEDIIFLEDANAK